MHVNNGMELWGKNSLLVSLAVIRMLSDGATYRAELVLEKKENSPFIFIFIKLYLNRLHRRHTVILIWYG